MKKQTKQTTTGETPMKSSNVILSQAEALAKFNDMKADIEAKKAIVEGIEVTNDITYNNMHTSVTFLSKTVKAIDARRKEVNEPAKLFIEQNNELAKRITGDCESVIAKAKNKLLVYDTEVARKKAEEQKRIDEENEARLKKIREEDARKLGILNKIGSLVSNAEREINEAIKLDSLDEIIKALSAIFIKYYKTPKTDPGDMAEFPVEFQEALSAVLEMGKKAKQDAEAGKYEKVVVNDTIMQSLENATEDIHEETYHKTETILETSMSVAAITHNKSRYRTSWKGEVMDFTKLPDRFKSINNVAINEFISELKANADPALVDGGEIYGIRFIKVETPILA